MSAPNDTTPDERSEADTDPTSATIERAAPPTSAQGRAALANDTDPTWPPSSAPVEARADTSPDLDILLGGIHARPPVDPIRKAESAGEDAAVYATSAEPAKAHRDDAAALAPPVIVAITEPMPVRPPRATRSADPPAPAPVVRPHGAARQQTTVSGKRGPKTSAGIFFVAAALVAAAAVGWALVHLWRPAASAGSASAPLATLPTATPPIPPTASASRPSAPPDVRSAPSSTAREQPAGVASPPRATQTAAPGPSHVPVVPISPPTATATVSSVPPKHEPSPKDDGLRSF